MNTRKLLICVCSLMCAALAGCSRYESEWQPLPLSDAGFSVLMRGSPQYVRQELQTPAGLMVAHLYSSDRPDAYYAVGYADYPLALVASNAPQNLFDGVRETWLKRIGGKLLASGTLELDKRYAGYEFSADGAVKSTPAFLQARLYLVDQRLYQVIAIGRKGEVSQAVMNRFVDSFRLIPIVDVGSVRIEPRRDKQPMPRLRKER